MDMGKLKENKFLLFLGAIVVAILVAGLAVFVFKDIGALYEVMVIKETTYLTLFGAYYILTLLLTLTKMRNSPVVSDTFKGVYKLQMKKLVLILGVWGMSYVAYGIITLF